MVKTCLPHLSVSCRYAAEEVLLDEHGNDFWIQFMVAFDVSEPRLRDRAD